MNDPTSEESHKPRQLYREYSIRVYNLFNGRNYIDDLNGRFFQQTCPTLTWADIPELHGNLCGEIWEWKHWKAYRGCKAVVYYIVVNHIPKFGFTINAKR